MNTVTKITKLNIIFQFIIASNIRIASYLKPAPYRYWW